MDEYIERECAIEAVKHAWAKGLEPSKYLEIIPAVDVATVRHGRWIYHPVDLFPGDFTQECSCCHEEEYLTLYNVNYCPNCGAKMDGGAD